MIRRLRRRHRLWTTALAVVVPIGFVAALAARPARPVGEAAAGSDMPRARAIADWSSIGELPISGAIEPWRGARILALTPREPLARPDLLVYWSPGGAPEPPAGGALPPDVVLLGALGEAEERYRLPPGTAAGTVVIYSLGHHEVVGSIAVAVAADPSTDTDADGGD